MPSTINLGANLPVVADWQGTNIFTNLMKQSRGLSSFEDPAEIPANIPLDSNGYPLERFGVVVKAPLRAGDDGEYLLKFKGKAQAGALPAAITVQNQRSEGAWQIADLVIPPVALSTLEGYKEPILMLRFDDLQGEPVQEISLVKKSLLQPDGTFPTFHPVWVEHLRRFKVLRFMNWMSYWLPIPKMDWADRPGKDRLTQADTHGDATEIVRGVAPEYIVELARLVGSDIWINIPPLATDDYLQGLADFLAANLPATVKIYTEYGNELWASGWQGQANQDLAIAEILGGDTELNHDNLLLYNDYNRFVIGMRRYARRTKQIGDIFKTQFESRRAGDASRIRPVYCYQSVNPESTLKTGLDFLERQYTSVAGAIWGISPKTGVDEGFINKPKNEVTEADVIQSMRESLARIIGGYQGEGIVTPVLEQAAALAAWHNIAYAAYEGGIGFSRPGQIAAEVAFEMMRHNWNIYDICSKYLQSWFSYGNDNLLCWFIAGASDWKGLTISHEPDISGLTWQIDEQNTYPIQAIDAALSRGTFDTTAGLAIPGTVDTRRHTERTANWESSLRNDQLWQSNNKLYLLNAPTAKSYSFQLVSEQNPGRETRTEIWVNNKKATTITVPLGTGSHTSTVYKVSLRKGMNALKMIYSDGSMGNYSLIVK